MVAQTLEKANLDPM